MNNRQRLSTRNMQELFPQVESGEIKKIISKYKKLEKVVRATKLLGISVDTGILNRVVTRINSINTSPGTRAEIMRRSNLLTRLNYELDMMLHSMRDVMKEQINYKKHLKLLKKSPATFLFAINEIKNKPWFRKIIKFFHIEIKSRPHVWSKAILSNSEVIIDLSFTEKLIKLAIKNSPENFFRDSNALKLKNNYPSIFPKLVKYAIESINLELLVENFELIVKVLKKLGQERAIKKIKKQREVAIKVLNSVLRGGADFEGFLGDRAIQSFFKISPRWLSHIRDNHERAEFMIRIARNLYVSRKPITQSNVREEYARILELQQRLSKMPIYKKRRIICLFNNEEGFYSRRLIESIRRQGGTLPNSNILIARRNTPRELENKKKKFLKLVREERGAITINVLSHGAQDGIFLAGENRNHMITYQELGDALIARQDSTPVILSQDTCNSSTFMRKLYRYMRGRAPLPIAIGSSEFGQASRLQPSTAYRTHHQRRVLRLDEATRNNPTIIGDVINGQMYLGENGSSNATLYAPSDGAYRHVAENTSLGNNNRMAA